MVYVEYTLFTWMQVEDISLNLVLKCVRLS
jgi:hypothetical protein